jgi:hypothetical protein
VTPKRLDEADVDRRFWALVRPSPWVRVVTPPPPRPGRVIDLRI